MFLGASAHCTDVGELAFRQLALTGLVAATNGLTFVHADPVGRKIRDLTLAFAAAFLWRALGRAVRPGRGGRDLRGLTLGGLLPRRPWAEAGVGWKHRCGWP